MISFGAVLNFCLNSLVNNIWCMSGFWIWLRAMILYVCSLPSYFFAVCFWLGEKRVYVAVLVHASSIAYCFMGKFLMVVCTWISHSLSSW